MSKIYTDYINRVAISVPDQFIDVKTGVSHPVTPKIQEQIEYHANNSTLVHLVFSALNHYLKQNSNNGVTEEILHELAEIKRMMEKGYILTNHRHRSSIANNDNAKPRSVNLKEVEDVLEAFGG